jgi:tagatose-6-phosphate ketose/aldose isomerase
LEPRHFFSFIQHCYLLVLLSFCCGLMDGEMNPLATLLALPDAEKQARGVEHTPNEIAQQPQTWSSTYETFCDQEAAIRQFLREAGFAPDSARHPTVFLVGAGTSDYIGRSLAQLLRRCWQCEVLAVPSTDLLTHSPQWLIEGRPYLWISFSRSGESPEGVAVLEHALKHFPHIHHLVVSCNQESSMLRLIAGHTQALGMALPEAVHDRGLAMTSSFSNMVVFGHCLAHADNPESYRGILRHLAQAGTDFLHPAAVKAAELAGENFANVCFVGSGPLKAVAKESALKVLELTAGKVRTTSESALGLRHGPMAALDRQTLLVAFLSGDEKIREYELDLLQEVGRKKLVAQRVVIGPNSIPAECSESVLATEEAVADDYRPPLDVIFGQLLGLFFSLRHGLKPDCPSPTGAISRVVQNVRIHA